MKRRGMTYVEVLVVIGLILVVIAFVLPLGTTGGRSRETANRVKCASNLRQIGQALLMYANDNKGAYPRTIYAPRSRVIPTWGTGAAATDPFGSNGPAPNDVTAALYLLLRTQDITPEVFVCASSNQEKWDFGGGANTALNWSNWIDLNKHLSYSFHNPYENETGMRPFRLDRPTVSERAIAADKNPGPSYGQESVMTVTTTSSARQMKAGNSDNHDRDGQNILYGDGHVDFQTNPFVGMERDNIYTTKATSTALSGGPIIAAPFNFTDSILLPASP